MFQASKVFREHFRGKDSLKIFNEKIAFVLQVYDLAMTNIDLLINSSNHKAMFPKYSKNIPQISVSKTFQGYFPNIAKL